MLIPDWSPRWGAPQKSAREELKNGPRNPTTLLSPMKTGKGDDRRECQLARRCNDSVWKEKQMSSILLCKPRIEKARLQLSSNGARMLFHRSLSSKVETIFAQKVLYCSHGTSFLRMANESQGPSGKAGNVFD